MSALTKRRISLAAIVLAAVLYLEAGQVLGWDPSLFILPTIPALIAASLGSWSVRAIAGVLLAACILSASHHATRKERMESSQRRARERALTNAVSDVSVGGPTNSVE